MTRKDKQIDENYRKGSASERCEMCRFYNTRTRNCALHMTLVGKQKVCDSFEVRETNGPALIR